MGRAQVAHGRYAVAARKDRNTPPDELKRLKTQVAAELLTAYIQKTLAKFPPLSDEQRARLRMLLK
jgi:hypothetical protein